MTPAPVTPKLARTWGKAHERALARLVAAVEAEHGRNGGDAPAAVLKAVLRAARVEEISELAERMGEDRTQLSRCLRLRQPLYDLRRRLDLELGLPPGGMERVLSLVEGRTAEEA